MKIQFLDGAPQVETLNYGEIWAVCSSSVLVNLVGAACLLKLGGERDGAVCALIERPPRSVITGLFVCLLARASSTSVGSRVLLNIQASSCRRPY